MPGIIFLEHRGEGTSLMEAIKNYRSVYLVDAVQAGTAPGEIIRFEAHSESLPAQFSASSTHSFGVAEAIEMLRMLGELPQRLIVFGVQGFNFAVGTRMSPEVEQAVPHLVDVICQELSMAEIEE